MQGTWSAGIDWVEKVPGAIEQSTKKWFQELQILLHIKVDNKTKSILKPIFPSIHFQMHEM